MGIVCRSVRAKEQAVNVDQYMEFLNRDVYNTYAKTRFYGLFFKEKYSPMYEIKPM